MAVFLPLDVHGLALEHAPARKSVKLHSIAVRFEPLCPEKGHAKNSTSKRFRETTKLSLVCFYFVSQVKLKDTLSENALDV